MEFPYLELFGALLLVYLGYSYWQQLDPRYPVGAGLVLLIATALVEAGGADAAADLLAEFVFLLLLGGAVLLLLERFRRPAHPREISGAGGPGGEEQAPDTTDERERATQDPLDHLQQQPVAPVDAPGGEDDQDERSGDCEP